MTEDVKVLALKNTFMQELYSDWIDNYQSLLISDFLKDVFEKYKDNHDEFCDRGETGVFIDSEVLIDLNKKVRGERTKAEWDYDCSLILFQGKNNDLGIYRRDNSGNKLPITNVQATDPRLWNYLSLFLLNEYSEKRWGDSSDSKRIFLSSLTNEKMTRHSVSRLFWTAFICEDKDRPNSLELLSVLWNSEDFMTQITERATCNMRQQIQWFLDFCNAPSNSNKIFKEKSIEGYRVFRKFIKLYTADSNVLSLSNVSQGEINSLLKLNLDAC